ncbi:thermonuclease family protein [Bacillus swezeyi]|uniref:TNase-like domain-containing protein n=1 Tax=Bacillus swezeyi TaxID=1925020 RepID=A0A5M8RIK8_9BACI|nr:thermonuclease family protein [Bacillus swezeyi]KAA6446903.1 hypothetical protein DX927_22890 [Bacillus swezeyi]KAA6471471.1 hypothetical protein DX928_23130 [Bacillus swezeyi]
MRRFKQCILVLIIILIAPGCEAIKKEVHENTGSRGANHNSAHVIDAHVIHVIDGDTIQVRLANKTEKIRMILVDTPETKHPTKPVQPFGIEAANYTTEQLEGKDVKIELGTKDRDSYNRILAYVYLNSGEMFNKLLIKKGFARVAIFPPNTKYVDEFLKIEEEAKSKKVGIWSVDGYVIKKGFNNQIADDSRRCTSIGKNSSC